MCALKDKYFELLKRDLSSIKSLIELYICPTDEFKDIYNDTFFDTNFENLIKFITPIQHGTLITLLRYNKDTKLINLFSENIIEQVLRGRVCESAKEDYKELKPEQRDKYLGVVYKLLESNSSGIENMYDIKDLCASIILQGDNEKQPANTEENGIFIQKIRTLLSNRPNPVEDLIELYKCKIPSSFKFIYDELISNLEQKIHKNELGEISEELIFSLMQNAPNNTRLHELLSNVLEKQYANLAVTTDKFVQDVSDVLDRTMVTKMLNKGYEETSKLKEKYLELRTEAYLRSIGKSEQPIQHEALMQLQKQRRSIHNPQYIPYISLAGEKNFIIIETRGDTVVANTRDLYQLESDDYISMQQNKGKKGIRGLFKKNKDKEIVSKTIVLGKEGDTIQAINKYETGRFEVVELKQGKFRIKIINREDASPIDIGNNGAMVLTKSFMERSKNTENSCTLNRIPQPNKKPNIQKKEEDERDF